MQVHPQKYLPPRKEISLRGSGVEFSCLPGYHSNVVAAINAFSHVAVSLITADKFAEYQHVK